MSGVWEPIDSLDSDILWVLRKHFPNGGVSYVICNMLRRQHQNLTTAKIRYRLKRMERAGLVTSDHGSPYFTSMLHWKALGPSA